MRTYEFYGCTSCKEIHEQGSPIFTFHMHHKSSKGMMSGTPKEIYAASKQAEIFEFVNSEIKEMKRIARRSITSGEVAKMRAQQSS